MPHVKSPLINCVVCLNIICASTSLDKQSRGKTWAIPQSKNPCYLVLRKDMKCLFTKTWFEILYNNPCIKSAKISKYRSKEEWLLITTRRLGIESWSHSALWWRCTRCWGAATGDWERWDSKWWLGGGLFVPRIHSVSVEKIFHPLKSVKLSERQLHPPNFNWAGKDGRSVNTPPWVPLKNGSPSFLRQQALLHVSWVFL